MELANLVLPTRPARICVSMLVSYHIAMFEDVSFSKTDSNVFLLAYLIIFGLPFALFPFDCAFSKLKVLEQSFCWTAQFSFAYGRSISRVLPPLNLWQCTLSSVCSLQRIALSDPSLPILPYAVQ
jgi:hypothetical protein